MVRHGAALAAIIVFLFSVPAAFAQQGPDPDMLKAQDFETRGMIGEARAIYEKLYRDKPTDLYFWKLILLYERTTDYKAMKAIAMKKLETVPGDVSTLNYLSKAYRGMGDASKAREVLYGIIGDKWMDTDRVRNAGNELAIQGDLDGAADVYATARKKTGAPDLYAFEMARLCTARMLYAQALAEYLKVIETYPAAYPFAEQMLRTIPEGQVPAREFTAPLESYLRKHSGSILAGRLLALVRTRSGDTMGAVRAVLDPAIASGNTKEMWTLAEDLNARGMEKEAVTVYAALAEKFPADPNRSAAILKSASLRMSLGDREGAKRDYDTLIGDYSGKPEASLAAIRLLDVAGTDAGIDVIAKLKEFAESAADQTVVYEANTLLADKLLRSGDIAGARTAADRARRSARAGGESFASAYQSAMIRFYGCEFTQMATEIDACVSASPAGERANELLVLRFLHLKAMAAGNVGDFTRYAHGRYALLRGMEKAGIDSLTSAAADTLSPVAPEAARAIGSYLRGRGDRTGALEWFSRAAAAARDTTIKVAAMMDAADVHLVDLGDRESAKKLYTDALMSFPGSVFEPEIRTRLRSVTEK